MKTSSRLAFRSLTIGSGFFFAFGLNTLAFADPLPPVTTPTRLLVLAPHPDDGMLQAGLIQRTIRAGGQVRVIDLTAGDGGNKQGHAYVQRQGYHRSDNEAVNYGYYRQVEETRASRHLGMTPEHDDVWLGYPDGGMWEILQRGLKNDLTPYTSPNTGLSAVPYDTAFHPGAPYLYASVVSDIQAQLVEFHPDLIIATHPNDNHPDHASGYYFMTAAMKAAGMEDIPLLIPYDLYGGLLPTTYEPNFEIAVPEVSKIPSPTKWSGFFMNAAEIEAKKEYVAEFGSQMAWEHPTVHDYHGTHSYMFGYVTANELYGQVVEARYDKNFQDALNRSVEIQRGLALIKNILGDLVGFVEGLH